MKFAEIENMSASAIKGNRADIEAAVKDAPELVPRYVSTLIDAKVRDEKLAEQGKTITALQDALDAAKKTATQTQAEWDADRVALKASDKAVGELGQQLEANAKANEKAAGELRQQLQTATQGCATAQRLATQRRKVLADITSLIAPLLVSE